MNTEETKQTVLSQFTVLERAVLYARVSKDDRGNESRNLNGQIEMGREYAYKKGYSIVEEIKEDDRGASAAEIDLPELNKIRAMAKAKQFDVLIVRELDRLSRNLAKQLIVEEELNRYGIRVEYVLAEYDDTPEGRLNKHVRATIAEYEREKITERMVRGRRNKVKDGNILTSAGRAPYGYEVGKIDGKNTFIPDKNRAGIVKKIFLWYVRDGLTQGEIADKLDELNAPLPKHSISKNTLGWGVSTISKMLTNETYKGTWHYGKNHSRSHKKNPRKHWIPVSVPALVSEDLWEAAQIRKKQALLTSKRNKKVEYLLSGFMKCGHCGMCVVSRHIKNKKKGIRCYYYCGSKSSREVIPRDCELNYFRSEKVDTAVWNWLKSLIMNEEELREGLANYKKGRIKANAPLYERLEIIENLLEDYTQQFERLLDLYLSGDIAKDLLTDKKISLENTIKKLEAEKINLQTRIEDKVLTETEITNIVDFTRMIRDGLQYVDDDNDFKVKRKIFQLLGVKVTFKLEAGEQVIYVECKLANNPKPLQLDAEPPMSVFLDRIRNGYIGNGW